MRVTGCLAIALPARLTSCAHLVAVIGHFFMLNLVLAVVVRAHSESTSRIRTKTEDMQRNSLRAAFTILASVEQRVASGCSDTDQKPVLSPATILSVFGELNHYRDIAHIGEARAQVGFTVARISQGGRGGRGMV